MAKKSEGFPNRLPEQARQFGAPLDAEWRFFCDLQADDVPRKLLHAGDESATRRIFVWGDSHAMHTLPVISRLSKEAGLGVKAAVHSGWAPVLSVNGKTANQRNADFAQAVVDHLAQERYEAVVLVGYWAQYRPDANFVPNLNSTIERLRALNLPVYFLKSVPTFSCSVPDVVVRRLWRGGDLKSLAVSPEQYAAQSILSEADLAQLTARGVIVLDPFPSMQRHFGARDVLPFDDQGLLYRDAHHISLRGGDAITPTFFPLIESVQQSQKPAVVTARQATPSNVAR